ncbi:MAG: metal-dependent transcriptional regulator [Candidatus Thorarchaeota archaeon]
MRLVHAIKEKVRPSRLPNGVFSISGKRETDEGLTDALEMYIKTIYEIERENGAASVTDIAERLGVRAPSVTAALQRLAEMGMVGYEKYRAVNLTRRGQRIAKRLMRTHDVLQDLFVLLGVDLKIAESDACEIEHLIHQETFDRIEAFTEYLSNNDEGKKLLNSFLKTHEKVS